MNKDGGPLQSVYNPLIQHLARASPDEYPLQFLLYMYIPVQCPILHACIDTYMVVVITLTFPFMLYTSQFLAASPPFYLYFPLFCAKKSHCCVL